MKSCPKCNGDGCPACKGSGMDLSAPVPACRICGKEDGSCEWDGVGYSHLRCREPEETKEAGGGS